MVANSWGPDWGESGYFKIQRGHNECSIEDYVIGTKRKQNNRKKCNKICLYFQEHGHRLTNI